MVDRHSNRPNRELSAELQAFEAQLAAILPSTGRLERDRLMFEAGKAAAEAEQMRPSASMPRWAWPAISTASTASAVFLLAMVLIDSRSPIVEKPVPRTGEITSGATDPSDQVPVRRFPDSQPDRPDQGSSHALLASLFFGDEQPRDNSRSTYFDQRNMLLALGGDRLPELRETPSAKGGRSNTRVSYADLLDELTLEAHGFVPGNNGPDRLKPLHQGTDL
ncbi:MAG: hypothetical protein GXX96_18385 [Planctomycetaceae bacterium]|nr:hypothetical protein [Planctomycetaceae bacterium]